MTDYRFTIHNLVVIIRLVILSCTENDKIAHSSFIHLFVIQFFNVNIYKSWIYLWRWKLIWKAKKSSSSTVNSALFSGIKNSFAFLIIIRQKRHIFWRNKYFHCFSLPVSLPVLFFLFFPLLPSLSYLFPAFSSFPLLFSFLPDFSVRGQSAPTGVPPWNGVRGCAALRPSFHALSAVP